MNAVQWIDRLLSRSLNFIFIFLFLTVVMICGVLSFSGIYFGIFEYQESLWDLSNFEIIFFLLFLALIYRHITYCIKHKVGVWVAISRPLYAYGYLLMLCLAFIGAIMVAAGLEPSKSSELMGVVGGYNGLEQMIILSVVLLTMYLSTPVKDQQVIASNDAVTEPNEDLDRSVSEEKYNQEEKSI